MRTCLPRTGLFTTGLLESVAMRRVVPGATVLLIMVRLGWYRLIYSETWPINCLSRKGKQMCITSHRFTGAVNAISTPKTSWRSGMISDNGFPTSPTPTTTTFWDPFSFSIVKAQLNPSEVCRTPVHLSASCKSVANLIGHVLNHFVSHLRVDRKGKDPRLIAISSGEICRLVTQISIGGIKWQSFRVV